MFHDRTFLVLSAAVLFIAVSQFSCSETSEQQHKLGPFGPIKEYREKNKQ